MTKIKQKKEIRIAIAGVGNCASSLVQGIYYYKNVKDNKNPVSGLMHNTIKGYKISDIKVDYFHCFFALTQK